MLKTKLFILLVLIVQCACQDPGIQIDNDQESTIVPDEQATESPDQDTTVTDEPTTESSDQDTTVTDEPTTVSPDEDTTVTDEPTSVSPDQDTTVTDEPTTVSPDQDTTVTDEPTTVTPDQDTTVTDEPTTVSTDQDTTVTVQQTTVPPVQPTTVPAHSRWLTEQEEYDKLRKCQGTIDRTMNVVPNQSILASRASQMRQALECVGHLNYLGPKQYYAEWEIEVEGFELLGGELYQCFVSIAAHDSFGACGFSPSTCSSTLFHMCLSNAVSNLNECNVPNRMEKWTKIQRIITKACRNL